MCIGVVEEYDDCYYQNLAQLRPIPAQLYYAKSKSASVKSEEF